MKMPLFRKTVAAMIAAVAASAILPAAASTFTVGGSGNNFTISRTGDTSAAETVLYRTVPLSAFPGQHYTEKGGTLVFAPHIEKKSDEVAANLMVSLIRQCTYLLARQIAQLEADFKKHGGIKERMYAARSESRAEDRGKAAYSHLAAVQTPDELASRCREMTVDLRRMADGFKRRKGWA